MEVVAAARWEKMSSGQLTLSIVTFWLAGWSGIIGVTKGEKTRSTAIAVRGKFSKSDPTYLPMRHPWICIGLVGGCTRIHSWRSEGKINFHPHCTADDEDDDDGGFVLNFRII